MRKLIVILVFITLTKAIDAQEERKFFYGISVSVDLGRFQDRFELTPLLGVKVFSKTYVGIGLNISYSNTENIVYTQENNKTIENLIEDQIWYLGGNCFLRFLPFENKENFIKNLYLQTSYEGLWGNGVYSDETGKYDYATDNFTPFVGLGYKQYLGGRFSLGALVSFKLNNEEDSPYRNPIVRIAFEF